MLIGIVTTLVMAAAQSADDPASAAVAEMLADGAPAAAIIVVGPDGIRATEWDGVKRAGSDAPVAEDDFWHIGSNSKAVTATLAMTLVEDDLITLDSTVQEILGDSFEIHEGWQGATLRSLLSHRSGAPTNISTLTLLRYAVTGAEDDEGAAKDRHRVLKSVLRKAPQVLPLTEFRYSNLGYTIAGHMLEKVSGQTFGRLLEERVFTPLAMEGTALGAPARGVEVEFVGHRGDNPKPAPVGADNPAFMSPAGTYSYTLESYGAFLADQLNGHMGEEDSLLETSSYTAIRTPPDDIESYAFGWAVTEGGNLTHAGSNTMWFAVALLSPDDGVGVALLTNWGEPGNLRARAAALVRAYAEADDGLAEGSLAQPE